jgi:hypothetical protein
MVEATAARVSTTVVGSTAATSPGVSKASNSDSKVTCHTEVLTGSRVGVRVCETAAQREARQAAVRASKDQLSRPVPGCAQIGPGGCAAGN